MEKVTCLEVGRVRNIPKLQTVMRATQKRYNRFFGKRLNMPIIIMPTSRRQIDQITGRKSAAWSVGWISPGVIYILSPEKYTVESSHNQKSDFWKTLVHEYAHIYIRNIGGYNVPRWLNEGLACWLAKQPKSKPTIDEAFEVLIPYKAYSSLVYKVGTFWVKRLIEKYGQKKIATLISLMGEKMDRDVFKVAFRKTYGLTWKKATLKKLYK
ncbi:MAG: hypothetical protein WC734_05775 [Patescibacteria group bacterium]|jgi:hypothetical protein